MHYVACVCAGMRTERGGRSGVDAAGFEPEGGGLGGGRGGVTFRHDYIIMPNVGAPKKLHPVCSQFIARVNPTTASKLAFMKSDGASPLLIPLIAHCRKICM